MIARSTSRATALIALALAAPVLAGCGMQAKDETSKEHSQIQAASNHIGAIRIRNAFITTVPGATGTPRTYLVVALLNRGSQPDTFTGVTTSVGTATLDNHADGAGASSAGVTLPPGVLVPISHPDIDPDAATVAIEGDAPLVGTTEMVSFSFENAGTTGQIAVPVVSPGGSLTPTTPIPTDPPTFTIPIE